jgi:hypothetical protein
MTFEPSYRVLEGLNTFILLRTMTGISVGVIEVLPNSVVFAFL